MANLRDVARAVEQRGARKLARGSVVLPLPIFEGQYAGRFGVLDGERLQEFEQFTTRESVPPDEANEVAADFIADALRQVLGCSEAGGTFDPLEHDDGRPVRFDQDFAEALELEPPAGVTLDSMAAVVLAVFSVEAEARVELNTAALQGFAIRLLEWMQDTSRHVQDELAGESVGGPKS